MYYHTELPPKRGALSSQALRKLIERGAIKNATTSQVRPASLDLTITTEVYRIDEAFLPRKGEAVRDLLKLSRPIPHHLSHPLERNVTYIARVRETLHLPPDTYCICNPKSSTGRLDIQSRVIADGVPRYDTVISGGYSGEIWTLITPKSFPILLSADESLSQLRFFNADTTLDHRTLKDAYRATALLWSVDGTAIPLESLTSDQDGSLILGVDLIPNIVGWECLGSSHILDAAQRDHYEPQDFFTPLTITQGRIRLRQGGFYILYTKERVHVPPHLACEMVPMDEKSGEFRAHYAGFIDPGWGWGKSGETKGRRLVLEVRPFEDIVLRDSQPISKIRFCEMQEIPDCLYDSMDSNYIRESATPRLSKHFIFAQ